MQEQETFLAYSISADRPSRDLLRFAEQNIRLQLHGLEGLAEIEITGAQDPALTIRFYTELTERLNLNTSQILTDIRNRLDWRSSGFVEEQGARLSILVPPQYASLEDLRTMKISVPNSSRQVLLGDIAEVSIEDYPVKSIKRLNGSPALGLTFVRESGFDAIGLAETVRNEMTRIQSELPGDITLQLERDSTEDLRKQFEDLQYQSFYSLLVVFTILLLFIRRFRAPFVILGSILFSLLMSVSILFFIDYTLNVLTLAGLTVALGMIIDNAVVVFEQINPKLPKEREARLQHVKRELPYTIVPVFGSTLTTVGIFLPLFFAMEQLQLFLVPLAVALTLTLVSSLVIALSWIPYALIWLVPAENVEKARGLKDKLSRKLDAGLMRGFNWRYRIRWLFYIGFVAVIGIPLFAIDEPDWEETKWPEFTRSYFDNRTSIDPYIGGLTRKFFNETYFGTPWGRSVGERIFITIRTPQGTPLEEIDKMARNFELIATPYLEASEFFETNISEYTGARIVFYVKDEYMYRNEPFQFYYEAQFLAARTGNSGISVSGLADPFSTGFGSSSSGQRITLRGFSYDELYALAEDIERRMTRSPRVQGVDIHGVGFGSNTMFHYVLDLDDVTLTRKELNRRAILDAIMLDVNPTNERGRVELAGERMFLIGQNQVQSNYEGELMNRTRVSDQMLFTLAEISELRREQTLPQIIRENQSYQRSVSVDFLGPFRLAQNYIRSVLDEVPVPVGASIQYGGGFFAWGQQDQVKNYVILLLFTILSVWMITAALLENWFDPFVVILAVPLSLIGVMLGALFHDINFDQGAIAGTLLAVGIVVNNSILLIHQKQRCRDLGIHGLRSWVQVYRNKMRAVMITSLTTIGGLLPMIIIGSSDFWKELAVVVLWGLGTSLTLILLTMGVWEKPVGKGKGETKSI